MQAAAEGRAPYGARGLKYTAMMDNEVLKSSRAPYGARGLKFQGEEQVHRLWRSRPIRGAWIEITYLTGASEGRPSRAPYGARGLKSRIPSAGCSAASVAPHTGRVD